MGKKTAAGLLGTLITAGVAVGVAKYLKDYAGVRFTDDEQINKVKSDSGAVKEAAKRTYIAIKEKTDFKEAATELTKAAGSVVTDAADIARTASNETVQAFKDMKNRYDEDPQAFKTEVTDNLNDMTHNFVKSTQDKTEELVDRIKNAYNDFDVYEVENADEADAAASVSSDDKMTASGDDCSSETEGDAASESKHEAEHAAIDSANDDAKVSDLSANETEANETETSKAEANETEESKLSEETKGSSDDGSFKLNFVDDDNKDKGSNVTITDDAE